MCSDVAQVWMRVGRIQYEICGLIAGAGGGGGGVLALMRGGV